MNNPFAWTAKGSNGLDTLPKQSVKEIAFEHSSIIDAKEFLLDSRFRGNDVTRLSGFAVMLVVSSMNSHAIPFAL